MTNPAPSSESLEADRSPLTVDTSAWPIAVIRIGPGPVADVGIDLVFEHVAKLLERQEPHVLVIDTRNITMPAGRSGRDRANRWMNDARLRELGHRYKICDVLVIRSALVRAAVKVVNWMSPPPNPTEIFANASDAIPWTHARCEERGVPFTDAMRRALAEL